MAAITPRIEIRQSQSLLMTPQLRQAIGILQMNNLELNELVSQELESNPLLEREDDRLADSDAGEQTIDDYPDAAAAPEEDYSPDIDYDNQFDDSGSDREGYETGSDYSWDDYNRRKNAGGSEDFDYVEQKLSGGNSLYQHLDSQINLHFTAPRDKMIAFALAEQLDAAGYFRGSCGDIAARLGTKSAAVEKILKIMQTFEPSGIFARDLAETLSIQLSDRNRLDPMAAELLKHLDLLAARDFKSLKKLLNAEDEDLLSLIDDIKSLNPKPAADFEHDLTSYIIPDVFVRTDKHGNYLVELNNMSLPRVLVNRHYYSEIRTAGNKEARRYAKEQIGKASFLVKALHQRADTILRVSEEIVRSQQEFFAKGIEYLKPMQLKDIAEAVEMHESTVSRVTANKYMHTPRGIFELKYFFSAAAGSYKGDDSTSTLSIKHKIKNLINDEKPEAVLSDDTIVELLAREGVKIARRTVTKYREAMNIPGSAQRKRDKRPLK